MRVWLPHHEKLSVTSGAVAGSPAELETAPSLEAGCVVEDAFPPHAASIVQAITIARRIARYFFIVAPPFSGLNICGSLTGDLPHVFSITGHGSIFNNFLSQQ